MADVGDIITGRQTVRTSVSMVDKPSWHLNTAAPHRLIPGDRRLALAEAQLRSPEHRTNSAADASWSAECLHVSEGARRAAPCTDRRCLPTFTQTFPIRGGGGR